jgi:5-(carboxyamino)imidazole ribonucleotide synthase
MSFYDKKFTLGVLGGGQLGRMLIQDAISINLRVSVLDPDENAPCKEIAHEFVQGDFKDYDTVMNFGRDKDLITIEIEHVSIEALKDLKEMGVKVYPQPEVLEVIQDKGLQKQFYTDNDIPTAPYKLIDGRDEITRNSDFLPCMQKMRKGGYDGKGVTPVRSLEDLSTAFDAPSVMEKMVDFEKEISVIVARNPKGQVRAYPVVELEFNPKANLVEFLFCPAQISNDIEARAEQIAIDVANAFQVVGLLAVEMFLTKEGEILVNEVAPRPHNSGHQSIEGNYTSQFAQHLRAILDLPLGDTGIIRPTVMLNLLGEENHTGAADYTGLEDVMAMDGVYLHLYGKSDTKSYRKMGHVTVMREDAKEAHRIAENVKTRLKVRSK